MLNQTVQTMQSSGIRRFFGLAASMDGVISLGVGEPDFETPWQIKEAAIASITKGQTFYSENAGLLVLRKSITAYVRRKYQLEYKPETEVLVTVGASEAIDLVMRAMIDSGDEVIVTTPNYVSYQPCVTLAGGKVVEIPLREEDGFKLLPEDLEAAITEKTKLVVLAYPNNPTGAIMEKEDLEKIAEIVKKHDIFVMSDEIYSELNYSEQPHVSIGTIEGMKERTVVLNGFSKAFAMTGWRLGFLMAPELLIEAMIKIHQYTIVAPATFIQYAGVVALNDTDEEVEKMRVSYNQRRRFLMDSLDKIGVDYFEPKGAFYLFINVKKFGMTSEEFCQTLLHEQKLAVVPGSAFGQSGEGYARISYAYSLKQLKEAMKRLEKFVADRV